MNWIPTLTLGLALVPGSTAFALEQEGSTGACLEKTEVCTLSSSAIDRDYRIRVALPYGYESSDKAYPVLYLLDSDVLFGLVTDVSRLLPLEGVPMFLGRERVPEVIVVGIGYPGGVAEMSEKRGWDMNPPEGPGGEINPRGAADFFHFIAADLVPWVESSYRASPADRTLVGASRGGVFVISTLLLHPETFQRYVAISPIIEPPIYDYLVSYAERQERPPARLFLSAGSAGEIETGIAAAVSQLAAELERVDSPTLAWQFEHYPGESHVSVLPEALVDGLVAVFSEPLGPASTPAPR